MSFNKFEKIATECSKWEEWLNKAVDEASDIADKLDWSTEQVLGYAILQARSQSYEEAASVAQRMIFIREGRDDWAKGYRCAAADVADAIRSKAIEVDK